MRQTITHMDVFKNLHKISPRLNERDLEPRLNESVLSRKRTTIEELDKVPRSKAPPPPL